MWTDIKHCWRMLCHNPVYAGTAVLTLALGIAGNTAMFAVINAALLKPLPYRDPNALLRITLDSPRRGVHDAEFSLARYRQIRAASRSFADFGAFVPENFTLSGVDEPEQLLGARISANFLALLGVEPILGRSFTMSEDSPGAPPVALVSESLWKRRFGADPEAIGKSVILNSAAYTLIGVLPPGFAFPFAGGDVWVTDIAAYLKRLPYAPHSAVYLTGFARLAPGKSIEQARAEMNGLNRQYSREYPGMDDADSAATVRVVRLQDRVVENVRPALRVLFLAVGFVLLIACANVAGLLLARASSRWRELAVRAALGAARGDLIRHLFIESLTLALLAGAAGALLTVWGLDLLLAAAARDLPWTSGTRVDGVVLAFTSVLSCASAVIVGLVPCWRATRPDVARALREYSVTAAGSRSRFAGVNARGLLVIAQVAMSMVLLIGAALMIKSFARLRSVDLGFQPANMLTAEITLPPSRYDNDRKRAAFFYDLLRRTASIPGVRAATVAATLPTLDAVQFPIQIAGRPVQNAGERPRGQWQSVAPGYFRTLGIPLRRGREFTFHDNADSPWVVVINETMARRFWPDYPAGVDPVGEHMLFAGTSISAEIVGIAGDVHETSLAAEMGPEAYMPAAQRCLQTMHLLVRTDGDPRQFVPPIRRQVRSIDRDRPLSHVRTMDELLESSLAQQRSTLLLLALFGAIAVLLVSIGIYGVIAYSVAARTREMGIRRALGARPADIFGIVMRQALTLTCAGVVIGLSAALVLTRLLRGLLFHVSATDPAIFAIIALLFAGIAAAASYVPARRASRIDPMVAARASA